MDKSLKYFFVIMLICCSAAIIESFSTWAEIFLMLWANNMIRDIDK